jgi:hypothetical protein
VPWGGETFLKCYNIWWNSTHFAVGQIVFFSLSFTANFLQLFPFCHGVVRNCSSFKGAWGPSDRLCCSCLEQALSMVPI